MFTPTDHGYFIEKRGKMFYGFCDDACKPIVRANYWACRNACDRHRATVHEGQMILPIPQWQEGEPYPF